MKKLINFLAPFTPMKVAIINAILATMPDSTKEIVLDRVIAKQLKGKHIHTESERKLKKLLTLRKKWKMNDLTVKYDQYCHRSL